MYHINIEFMRESQVDIMTYIELLLQEFIKKINLHFKFNTSKNIIKTFYVS